MALDEEHRRRARRLSAEQRERPSVTPLELFFDLVFVLGFTQCTSLMAHDATWSGLGKGMLVLAVLWWSWVGYAWLTSVIDPEEGAVRIVMFAAMGGLLVVALCVPEAFGDRAVVFAVAYTVVRAAHIALYLVASSDDPDLRRSVLGLGVSSSIAVAFLATGAAVGGDAQAALWLVAIAIDWGGPLRFGTAGWRLVPGHFAERHNLVIILALGESIVALGVGADGDLTAGVVAAAVLGIGLACALWWTYFDVVALVTERRLTQAAAGHHRNTLARDSYSYLHFVMVAGIVLAALGLEQTLAHLDEKPDVVGAFALLGGPAIYLLGHVVLRLRNAHSVNWQRLGLAAAFLALVPALTRINALPILAALNVALWSMIVFETHVYGEARYRLRHHLDNE